MTEDIMPPCRCCGGLPEQLHYWVGGYICNSVHRCANCGFQLMSKDATGSSADLWIKANEKNNPFIEIK